MYRNMPFQPIMSMRTFGKWGIDFFGPTNKIYKCIVRHSGHRLLNKWVESKATIQNDVQTIAMFLYLVFLHAMAYLYKVWVIKAHSINKDIEFLFG